MRVFQTCDYVFDRVEPHTNVREFHLQSFATRRSAHVNAPPDACILSIIAIAMESIADALKPQWR